MNWLEKIFINKQSAPELTSSTLYDEGTFYKRFIKDLLKAKEEVIIESPFISTKRLKMLMPVFEKLANKNIRVFIITREPSDNDLLMAEQAEAGILYFENLGSQVLIVRGGHHRKLAMIDRKILWEGSLNILSQTNSREFMRRIESSKMASDLFKFLQFDRISIFEKNFGLV